MTKSLRKSLLASFIFLDQSNKNDRIRNISREITFYLIFVIITTIAILSNSPWYWFSEVIEDEITNEPIFHNSVRQVLSDTRNYEEIWDAISSVLFESYLWEFWYKHSSFTRITNQYFEMYLLGVPRIRQVRVKNNSCEIAPDFKSSFKSCYGEYSEETKNTEPFGMKNSTEWIYHSASEIDGSDYKGKISYYDGSGYFKELNLDTEKSHEYIDHLKQNLWLDRQTRAIFLDFTVYNVNINLFCTVKIVFEIPACGGVFASSNISASRLILYLTVFDYFVLSCEIIMILYICYYFTILIVGMKSLRLEYFKVKWNYLEIIITLFGVLYAVLRIIMVIRTEQFLKKLNENENQYMGVKKLNDVHKYFNNICMVLFFAEYIKLFKYFELSGTLGQLNATIAKCSADLMAFLILFLLFFAAYAVLGYLLFGGNVEAFHTLPKSLFTLLKSVHSLEYKDITESVFGTIFLVTFAFFIFFLLINMFLAIINDTYALVQGELNLEQKNFDTINFFKRGAQHMTSCAKPIQNLIKISKPKPEKMTNIKKVLKLAKYEDQEINLLFSKYQIDDKEDISDEDQINFVHEVHKNNYQMFEAVDYIRNKKDIGEVITPQQFLNQSIQIKTLERNIKRLTELINQLSHRKDKIKMYRDQ